MKIFIADYLPLANKGEEEILRGIESLYNKGVHEQISFSVFGDVIQIEQVGNVTVFPKSLCYPELACRGKMKYLVYLLWAILDILGFYPYKRRIRRHHSLFNYLKTSDKILIGHDGFFNIRCAMLGNFLHKNHLHYGILGAGFNKPGGFLAWAYNIVFKKCFDNADYIILREKTAFDYVSEISNNPIVKLFPDPAFFCPDNLYDVQRVSDVFLKYGWDKCKGLRIGMTVCEDSISFSRAFINSSDRTDAHRAFIVNLMKKICHNRECTFFFLPHCIKQGKGDDLLIARDIKKRLGDSVDCKVIEEDLPVLDLKYIISRLDYVIGERTHSIINSIATATPFVSLTCSADFRTHDIIDKGCGLAQQIYDLDYPDIKVLFTIVERTIEQGHDLQDKLHEVRAKNESMKKNFQEII